MVSSVTLKCGCITGNWPGGNDTVEETCTPDMIAVSGCCPGPGYIYIYKLYVLGKALG